MFSISPILVLKILSCCNVFVGVFGATAGDTGGSLKGVASPDSFDDLEDFLNQYHRQLDVKKSFWIYNPATDVSDQAAIDLDQDAIELNLALRDTTGFENAQSIYNFGAHSGIVAKIKLDRPLQYEAKRDTTIVVGYNQNGEEVYGRMFHKADVGDTDVQIHYEGTELNGDVCIVGVLGMLAKLDGCFAISGNITIGANPALEYSYNPASDTWKYRSFKSFSKNDHMFRDSFMEFMKYIEFYGTSDYAHQWIEAAFDKKTTHFTNGNADFSSYNEVAIEESIRRATVYMSIWMWIVFSLSQAVKTCKNGCTSDHCYYEDVVHWDAAVAFYTGSLASADNNGYLLFGLANDLCTRFKTCGENADENRGIAKANYEIFSNFITGQLKLHNGDCNDVGTYKNNIVKQMTVPLIQGLLEYAYEIDVINNESQKAESIGAVFAAALVPLVYFCDEDDGKYIYEQMKIGHDLGATNYDTIRLRLEKHYECLQVTCKDIGGLYDEGAEAYLPGAEPCDDAIRTGATPTQGKEENTIDIDIDKAKEEMEEDTPITIGEPKENTIDIEKAKEKMEEDTPITIDEPKEKKHTSRTLTALMVLTVLGLVAYVYYSQIHTPNRSSYSQPQQTNFNQIEGLTRGNSSFRDGPMGPTTKVYEVELS